MDSIIKGIGSAFGGSQSDEKSKSGKSKESPRPASARKQKSSKGSSPEGKAAANEEDNEVKELKDLFAGARSSPLSVGVYARYLATQENASLAKQARKDKEERERIRQEELKKRWAVTKERREREVKMKEQRVGQRQLEAQKRSAGNAVREEAAELQARYDEKQQRWMEQMRQRTETARKLDAILDESEERQKEAKRREATRERDMRKELMAQRCAHLSC